VSHYAARVFRKETRGVVAVSADNGEVFYPDLDNPFVITVSAINTEERRAPWATYGPATDLTALGEFIIVPLRGRGYAWAMGTSYSVAIVARVAALVLSTNPNLTAEQLERIFFGSANDFSSPGQDPKHGHGVPNAVMAIQLTLGLPVDNRVDYVELYLCEPKDRPVSVVVPV
jgi:subtilisin family serine protease